MFGSFGMMELVLILVIVMIIFGAGKLPQLGEGLGKAIKGFKKSVHEPEPVEGSPPPHVAGQAASDPNASSDVSQVPDPTPHDPRPPSA
ncbi:hypothetical protein YTPLAS18_04770 [Nitrospira sp.]|nr:hypothetical protein YTPLAS18_04770 [Nitrospira sp.]